MITSAYIATSVEGFIARLDGAIDWLGGTTEDGEDYGYKASCTPWMRLSWGAARATQAFPDGLVQSQYKVNVPK